MRLALLFAGAILIGAATMLDGIGPHDEGLVLQWGERVAAGEWPYRDFWCNYGPGTPLLQGAMSELFGPSLLAWRILRVLVGATVAVLAYLLVVQIRQPHLHPRDVQTGQPLLHVVQKRLAEMHGWALAAWLCSALAMAVPLTPGPTAYALALGLGALLVPGRWAGVLAGAAAVFRPELGVAAAAGLVIRDREARGALIAAAVTLVAYLPFMLAAGGEFFDQTVGFAVTDQRMQRLPIFVDPGTTDPNKVLEILFPVLLLAATLAWALRLSAAAPLSGFGIAGMLYLLARADEFHLVPLSVAVAIGLAQVRGKLAVVGLVIIALHGADRLGTRVVHPGDLQEVADGVRAERSDAEAIAALRGALPPGDVLVAPPRFDRVRVGAPLLYTLLDRPNLTRYDVMQPGVVTEEDVQREMLDDLAKIEHVVRWIGPQAVGLEENRSARSSGVTLLDDAIAAQFTERGRFGDYVLLSRRS